MKYNNLRTTLLALMLLFAFSKTVSQVITPFTNIYQVTQKGGIVYLSNSSIGCAANPPTSGGTCQTGVLEVPPGGTYKDNSFNGFFIDIDGDPTTFMSSNDSLNLPTCSQITKAFLFWGASGATTPNFTTVKMKVGTGSYQTITAAYSQTNNIGFNTYHCYADVTSLVQLGGIKSRITVADIPSNQVNGSNSNIFGSWNLVVFYSNDLLTMRQLTVFNGLANIANAAGQRTVDIPFSGFLTPTSGPVTLELGVYVHDGDRNSTGDNLSFNGGTGFVQITDAVNPNSDVMNSTVSYNGVLTPFRIPNMNNTAGLDADIFVPNNATKNYIGNSITSATFQMTTSSETYLPQMITTAIDVYEPDVRASVRVTDVNGGAVVPGDILEYRVKGLNIGSDPSVNTYITDTLEQNINFVAGSIRVVHGQNLGFKTDGLGDDQGEYVSGSRAIKLRIGSGATSALGGTVTNSAAGADSTVFTYSVIVTDNCVKISCDNIIDARAYIWGTGAVSSNTYNSGSNPGIFDGNGCPIPGTTSSPITATACVSPTAAANPNAFCATGSFTLSTVTNTNVTYAWSGPNSFTSNVQNPVISSATSSMAGVYTTSLIAYPGCMQTATTSVSLNNCPTAAADASNTAINTPVSGNVSTNDTNAGGGTFSITTQPSNGTVTINPANGQYTFTPSPTFTGVTTATYQLCNGSPVVCSNASLAFTVFPNIIANADLIITTPTLTATGTLVINDAGFTPTLGATYSVSVTQPSASTGTITVNPATGQYTFAPNASFTGTTATTYTICNTSINPQQCSNTTITITVVPAPLAISDATNTVINTTVTGNASTNDTGVLTGTYAITSQPISTSGTVSINPNTGVYTFTPTTGFTGTAQATYQLCNAMSPPCSTANITFTIYPNLATVANTIVTTPSVSANGNVLTNDIGITAGAVYSVSVIQPAAGVGTITLNSATGQYTFNPNPAYTGSVNTTYTVCNTSINPQQCSNTTITIIVGNPPAAVNDATNTVINTVVTGNAGTNDVGVPTGTFAISNQPANGTISINATTGIYSFTPATGFTGITTATYQLCNVLSPPCSNATITFSVYPNIVAAPNIISTTPSVAATGSLLVNDTGILTTGTLTANYSVTIIQPPVSTGTILVNPATGQYTFNPNPSFTGVSQATYNVCNTSVNPQQCSTTTITINVIPAPIAVNDATNTIINTAVTGNAATNDTGVLTGTFAVTTQPANGTMTINPTTGVYSFTPAVGFTGVTTATYQLCNVISVPCASASITFTVYPNLVANNDAIIVTPSVAATGTLLANDLGIVTGGNYTVSVTPISPTTGTLTYNSATGQYTFLPNPTFTGQVNTTYTVCNLSVNPVVCSNATINIVSTALAINDATNTIINTPVSGNASTNDLNAVGGTYTVTGQPASGTVTMSPNGVYSFTPNTGFTGVTTATYQLCNGIPVICTNATINFTVYPTITASPDIINTIVSVNATGTLTTNDLGAASVSTLGGTYSVSVTQPPASTGTLVVNPTTGTYLFIPNPTFSGSTTTTYTICNTSINPQQCSNTTVTINVVPPPVAVNDGTTTTSTSAITGDVSLNDTGVLTGTFSIINPSNDGSVTINPANGNYTFVPTPGFTGTTQVIYQLCNFASPPCATAAIVFTVYPSVLSNTSTTFANTSVVGDASASNTPSTGLTYGTPTVVGTSNGTLVISANGSYTFTPASSFTGTTQYIVPVCNNTVVPPVCSNDTIFINVIPALVPETSTVTNGSSVSGNVLSNEPGTIPTTGSVNTTPLSGPNHGTFTITPSGTFTYTSTDPNFVGYDTVRVTVCVGSVCSTNTIIITVYPNLKPNTSTTFMNNPVVGNAAASNTPSTGLTYGTPNLVGASHGTMVISPNGNYTFTPAPGFTGTTQYVVSVCNNSVTPPICKNDTININVIPGLNPETMTLTAGSNVTGNVLSNEPSGIQNGTVTTTPISGPHHGVITITPNGNFTYTPTNPNYSGYDTVQVTICVGTVCATNTIMITVYPNLGNDSGSITPGGSTVTGNVLDNDHGTGLTVNSIPTTNPIGGTVVLNPNGTYVYTPNQNYCGVDSFAYQACDNSVPVLCKTAWVHITIPCEDVVSVPEGFSPNADGVNDVLVVKGISKYPDNKIVIFNRWGNVVFEGNADLNKWDGKSNAGTKIGGDDLPVGTYFYILDLKTTGKKNLKGYIYLQR